MGPSQQKETIESLYDTYADAIFRFVLVRIRDRERALDITQETFVRMWNSYVSKGDDIEQPRALLYTIARNLIINAYERDKVHDSIDTLADEGIDIVDAEAAATRRALASDVQAMLCILSPEDKEMVTMRHLEGFSIKEIASIYGLTENAVSVRIHRAMDKLHQEFKEDEDD